VACQTQSRAHAAKALGISQSTLSQLINDRERELGLDCSHGTPPAIMPPPRLG
jgi:DNA-binding transcriptional LysR family regulator